MTDMEKELEELRAEIIKLDEAIVELLDTRAELSQHEPLRLELLK